VKTIKEELQDAVDLDMDKRELGRICGNALAEIVRLETADKDMRKALGAMVLCMNEVGRLLGGDGAETCH
jgi:hypothetical protein